MLHYNRRWFLGHPPRCLAIGTLRELWDATDTVRPMEWIGCDPRRRTGIDDFGMGYSSLSYLQHLPITTVTLDRSFVSGSTTNPNDAAIATAIIVLAHKLTLQVVAEGVETADQVNFVWSQQADAIQGYLCSPPMSAAMLTQHLHTGCTFLPNLLARTTFS